MTAIVNDIVLRKAGKKDAPHVLAMLQELARELDKEDENRGSLKALETYGFGSTAAFEAILAWKDDAPVGLILFFYEFSTWRGRPGVYIQDFYVAPEARSTGLGLRLTAAAAARGHKRGATYLRLAVHHGNDDGMGFYLANGFAPVEDETVMLLEGAAFKDLIDETG